MNVVKFTKDSTLQRIKASYIEEDFKLTEHEEAIKKRLLHFHSLRFDKKYSRHQAVKIHCREMGVSKATAYRDAAQSEFIFGSIQKVEVEFERAILMENYWMLYQMSLKNGDTFSANKALDSYKSLVNFNAEAAKVNPEKLEAIDIEIKLNRQSRKVIQQAYKQLGVIDLNNVDVSDVSYKDVSEDEEKED
ncbi:hypothetical protein EDL98_01365 [Ornithobacterium rhinotracheale]|nr:hypothetical protein [Ornithobacterium rhinotracheale]